MGIFFFHFNQQFKVIELSKLFCIYEREHTPATIFISANVFIRDDLFAEEDKYLRMCI